MTREEAIEFIAQSVKSDVDMAKVADAIKALKQEPIKNHLGVDCVSREQALDLLCKKCPVYNCIQKCVSYKAIEKMSSVTPQEPRCRECKWWKDSDGKYRRGIGAESQCPMNTYAVYCGDGYCHMFSPKADMRGEE